MKKIFTDFYEAWWWLQAHPAFYHPILSTPGNECQYFQNALDIDFQKVNPATNRIDDDITKNIKIECWLECGGFFIEDNGKIGHYHDPDLDCGGDTFEKAIVELANKVSHYYSNTGEKFKEELMNA